MKLTKLDFFRDILKKEKFDGILISSVFDIQYLTGISNFSKEEREAFIFITVKNQFILTDARYCEMVVKKAPQFELLQISSNKPVKEHLKELAKKLKIKKIKINENEISAREFKIFQEIFDEVSHLEMGNFRNIKIGKEVEWIEKACELGDRAFKYLLKRVNSNITEEQLVNELEFFIRKNGGKISFEPIVAFGANASIPHHQTVDKKLNQGDFVLLDFGVKYKNYCSDMTRTLVFGKASQEQKRIYQVVREAQEKAVDYILRFTQNDKMDIKAAEVDKVARDYIISKGYPSIPHSLGHGIGLQVHEHPFLSPRSKEILRQGMVFSIEPGIYIEKFGGVRIEDLYILEKNGLRQLTKSNKELIII